MVNEASVSAAVATEAIVTVPVPTDKLRIRLWGACGLRRPTSTRWCGHEFRSRRRDSHGSAAMARLDGYTGGRGRTHLDRQPRGPEECRPSVNKLSEHICSWLAGRIPGAQ